MPFPEKLIQIELHFENNLKKYLKSFLIAVALCCLHAEPRYCK